MDPITLEICWNRLIGVVNEQAAALQRTSFTSIVREAGDLSAGVFDRRGYMVAQAVTGTPGHINSMALAMKHFLAACPLETLRPGDVLITNDPWLTSGHLNDVTIASPIFRGEECIAFFPATCHTADIGGHVLSAEAREVYEEGLQIPILKLYEAGRPNETLIAVIRENTRLPEMVLGDFHAQIAGGAVGGERLLEFMDEFGLERLEPLADEIIGRTERAMRQVVAGALGQAVPERVMAEGSANIWGVQVSGKDLEGRPFTHIFFASGGTGARAVKDGLAATAFPSGVLGTPVEVIENLSPLIVERKALRDDSGGAGKYRGGLGQTIAFRVRTREPFVCSILCDRTATPALGFRGGAPGARGEVLIDGVHPANPKAEQVIPPNALVEVRLPGGGGYGPPTDRDPDLLARDLLEAYVTR